MPIVTDDVSESDVSQRRVVQSTDGSLSISNVRSRDSGIYTCRAFNSVGADTHLVQLVVNGQLHAVVCILTMFLNAYFFD